MSVTIYKPTPCNIPEERIPQARNRFGKLQNFVEYCAYLGLFCAESAIKVLVNIYRVRRNFYVGDAVFLLPVNKEELRCQDVALAFVFGSSVCHSYQFLYLRNLPSGSGAWNNSIIADEDISEVLRSCNLRTGFDSLESYEIA